MQNCVYCLVEKKKKKTKGKTTEGKKIITTRY